MNESIPETQSRLETFPPSRLALLLVLFLALLLTIRVILLAPTALASKSDPHSNIKSISHQLATGDVTIAAQNDRVVIDSNKQCAQGPTGGYVEVQITNPANGVGTLSNVVATISNITANAAVLGIGESNQRYIGTLADGATASVYWYISYTQGICGLANNTDLAFNYTVSVDDGSGPVSTILALTAHSDQSANAGGGTQATILGPGTYLGQLLPITITFSNGNTGAGAVSLFEPQGDAAHNAGCFRLVNTVLDPGATGYTGLPAAGTQNQLEYYGTSTGGTNNILTETYTFQVLCAAAPSDTLSPYSTQGSGTQEKYLMAATVATLPGSNPLTIVKTVAPSFPAGPTILHSVWTVQINNSAPVPVYIDEITNTLPTLTNSGTSGPSPNNLTYDGVTLASDVQGWISSQFPVITGTIVTGQGNLLYLRQSVPNYLVPANGSLKLIITTDTASGAYGDYKYTAEAQVGNVVLGPVFATDGYRAPTAVTLSTFDGHANGGLPWLPLTLGAVGMLILGSLAIVLGRKQ